MAARVGGLLVVLVLLGCATGPSSSRPPAPPLPLTTVEEARKARCAERGGSFEYVNGRWHCLAR
jgi:hypothetical protein